MIPLAAPAIALTSPAIAFQSSFAGPGDGALEAGGEVGRELADVALVRAQERDELVGQGGDLGHERRADRDPGVLDVRLQAVERVVEALVPGGHLLVERARRAGDPVELAGERCRVRARRLERVEQALLAAEQLQVERRAGLLGVRPELLQGDVEAALAGDVGVVLLRLQLERVQLAGRVLEREDRPAHLGHRAAGRDALRREEPVRGRDLGRLDAGVRGERRDVGVRAWRCRSASACRRRPLARARR
jgi:hypothetical protein